jgi:uncharacterized membrane protein YcaP (DUF421 family)
MDKLLAVDWQALFLPTHSLLEMVVRGTLMYVALFLVFRFVMKRQTGSVGLADILVIVIIADAAQNAFARSYESISEGVVLVLTVVFWNFVIDWASFRIPAIGKLLQEPPLPLVRNGVMMRQNMRREFVTIDELQSLLRKQGVDDIARVKLAAMESDGEISVITHDKSSAPKRGGRSSRRAAGKN